MGEKLSELTTTNFAKAQIIITRLESMGIECFLKNVNLIQPLVASGVKIYVSENDLESAINAIEELHDEIYHENQPPENSPVFSELIIVPVDFSDSTLNACHYAIDLASRFKARIKLIHAYGIPDIRPISFDDSEIYQAGFAMQMNDLRQEAETKMNDLKDKVSAFVKSKKFGEIPVSSSIINGIPDEIVSYAAQTENAGLIVANVSRKENRTFEPMDKIVEGIIEKTSVPILVIPGDSVYKGIDKFRNILYVTDFDESDFPAINRLANIVQKIGSTVYCVHISKVTPDPWETIKMEGLREYFSKIYNKGLVEANLVVEEDVLKGLDDFIKSHQISALAVISHKRNFIWKLINPGLAHKILYHTEIPLLVFHG